MRVATALSTELDFDTACRDAATRALADLGGADVDLCFVFVAGSYGAKVQGTPALVTSLVDPTRLVGCSAGGIIGGGIEVQDLPAVSITLLSIPGSGYECVHLIDQDLPDEDAPPAEWVKLFGTPPDEATGIILLPDPYSFATPRLLAGLDFAYPQAPKVGGLISGANHPGGNALFLDQTMFHEGAVAVVLSGRVGVETIVAQGCRPFGRIGRITSARANNLLRVDGVPAMQFLRDQFDSLSDRDKELVQSAPLFLGLAMDPFATEEPRHGEFLIRPLIGSSPADGSIAVGAELSVGRQVQFHLRDGQGSSQDLYAVLQHRMLEMEAGAPATHGALLFSCTGRGEHLFGRPNHDSEMFHDIVGRMPLGGFFCAGEIGPVQGATHLHGFTSAFALLQESRR